VLSKYDKEIYEKDFLSLIKEYFKKVYVDLGSKTVHKVLKTLLQFEFKNNAKWQLIENIEHKSLYVLLNDEAKKIWEQYIDIYNSDLDQFKKRENFSKIKPTFYNYVVNVPIPFGSNNISIDSQEKAGFYLVDPEYSNFYEYDERDFSKNLGCTKQENIFL
jgi:CRISPR-associated endonuclease/helicase Cas3